MPMTVPNETIFHQKKRFQKVQKISTIKLTRLAVVEVRCHKMIK